MKRRCGLRSAATVSPGPTHWPDLLLRRNGLQWKTPVFSTRNWVTSGSKPTQQPRDCNKAKRHTKTCAASTTVRETQIKTARRHRLTLIRMDVVKKSTNNRCWRRCADRGAHLHCQWGRKLVQALGSSKVTW